VHHVNAAGIADFAVADAGAVFHAGGVRCGLFFHGRGALKRLGCGKENGPQSNAATFHALATPPRLRKTRLLGCNEAKPLAQSCQARGRFMMEFF
jgi:hypothetical protein